MHARLIAAVTAAMFTASAADALTYTGSLAAGATTATYTIVTDGTFGALANANIVNVTATITSAMQTLSFTNPNFVTLGGTSAVASATQITFNTLVNGFFAVGQSAATFPVICLTGQGVSCNGEAAGAIFLAADFNVGDFEFTTGNAPYVLATIAGVPEPATWSLLIGGFGLAGLAMRRRRSAAVA